MPTSLSRRHFLRRSIAATAAIVAVPAVAEAHVTARPSARSPLPERNISLFNLHTGESVKAVYWADGTYVDDSLSEINTVLRDFRTGEVGEIDPHLMDFLHRLRQLTGHRKPFHVISGYRSKKTNAMLRQGSGGVAKRSYHLKGMAIDVRLPGFDTGKLRQAAVSLKAGGVGYYPRSDFIHVDTGRVRFW